LRRHGEGDAPGDQQQEDAVHQRGKHFGGDQSSGNIAQ
jgi:hypothetical protein